MAIYKETRRINATNTAVISAGANESDRFPGRLRVRMSDLDIEGKAPFNTLRIVNKSSSAARIHFTWGIDKGKYEDIEGNSIRNITIDDGISFYGFDVENLDALTDIGAGELSYSAARTEQIPEVL